MSTIKGPGHLAGITLIVCPCGKSRERPSGTAGVNSVKVALCDKCFDSRDTYEAVSDQIDPRERDATRRGRGDWTP